VGQFGGGGRIRSQIKVKKTAGHHRGGWGTFEMKVPLFTEECGKLIEKKKNERKWQEKFRHCKREMESSKITKRLKHKNCGVSLPHDQVIVEMIE